MRDEGVECGREGVVDGREGVEDGVKMGEKNILEVKTKGEN